MKVIRKEALWVLLFAFLGGACEKRCDVLLGVCPDYTPAEFEQNGVFETAIPTKYHGSAQSILIDDAGSIWVGGYMHRIILGESYGYPQPVIFEFDGQGSFVDSTVWHYNIFEGTVAGIEEDGDDLLLSLWGAQEAGVDTNTNRLKYDDAIRQYRFNKTSTVFEQIGEIESDYEMMFFPDLKVFQSQGNLNYTASMAYGISGEKTLLNTLGGIKEGIDLLAIGRSGSIVWEYTMPEVIRSVAVAREPQGSNVVVGMRKYDRRFYGYSLARLNDEGEEIWRKSYTVDSTRYRPKALAASSSGIYVLGEDPHTRQLALLGHDSEGTHQWTTIIDDEIPQIFWFNYHTFDIADLLVTSSGKIAFTWGKKDSAQRRYNTELTVVDSNGTIDQRIPVSPSYDRVHILAMKEAEPGRIVLAGSAGRYHDYLNAQNILLVGYDL